MEERSELLICWCVSAGLYLAEFRFGVVKGSLELWWDGMGMAQVSLYDWGLRDYMIMVEVTLYL